MALSQIGAVNPAARYILNVGIILNSVRMVADTRAIMSQNAVALIKELFRLACLVIYPLEPS
jgi:hypothetical membrane protein